MPARIRLIVTGDLERKAIAKSLRRMFPKKTSDGVDVEWLSPQKFHGATTHRLDPAKDPSDPMRQLAKAAVSEAMDGEQKNPSDLVIVVDDLELFNVGRAAVVVGHFRRAMEAEIERRYSNLAHRVRASEVVRSRCSFHLLSPMVESYLFGDHKALRAAGCGESAAPSLCHPDYEDFWCTDASFAAHCLQENQSKHLSGNLWWREERHSKHYLEHLVQQAGGYYEETVGGADAFGSLAWKRVPKTAYDFSLIRSLFQDVADFIGCDNPLGLWNGPTPTYVPLKARRGMCLRNV